MTKGVVSHTLQVGLECPVQVFFHLLHTEAYGTMSRLEGANRAWQADDFAWIYLSPSLESSESSLLAAGAASSSLLAAMASISS